MWRVWEGSTYRDLVGKSQGRRPFGKPRYRCTENIKIYCNRIRHEEMNRIDKDQGTDNQWDVVKPVINFQLSRHLFSNFSRNILPHALFSKVFLIYKE
jgi:hypothetical protein